MDKMQSVFFTIGIIFLFAAIGYFTYEYILSFSNTIKTILLVCATILTFGLAELLSERNM